MVISRAPMVVMHVVENVTGQAERCSGTTAWCGKILTLYGRLLSNEVETQANSSSTELSKAKAICHHPCFYQSDQGL